MIVFGFDYNKKLAKNIARKNNAKYATIKISRFPDGEKLIKIPVDVKKKKCIIVDSLHYPSEKIIDIIFSAQTLKDLKAKSITLVAPYLCYMRQDKRFHKGEAISAKILAKLFNPFFNRIITIDPHLHRIKSLNLLFRMKTKKLTANSLIGKYIKKHYRNVLVVGPDEESYQWAKYVADKCNAKVTVMKKFRFSSRHIKVVAKGITKIKKDIEEKKIKNVIIVDDIISTGHTMIEAVKYFKKLGAKNIFCIGVHGLFVENAYKKLKKVGVKKIITTNTIFHHSNKINVAEIIKL